MEYFHLQIMMDQQIVPTRALTGKRYLVAILWSKCVATPGAREYVRGLHLMVVVVTAFLGLATFPSQRKQTTIVRTFLQNPLPLKLIRSPVRTSDWDSLKNYCASDGPMAWIGRDVCFSVVHHNDERKSAEMLKSPRSLL